ncbi:Hypothetical predicted protein [Prunus dulcis]|uniref:Uncharacterized protein n=1 Tax=Prunus dulcis TaxID=3755 RepID=A0A5E4GBR7_PRUDU|nr:Hypothetical predicted protein [Prunus dulcis]
MWGGRRLRGDQPHPTTPRHGTSRELTAGVWRSCLGWSRVSTATDGSARAR